MDVFVDGDDRVFTKVSAEWLLMRPFGNQDPRGLSSGDTNQPASPGPAAADEIMKLVYPKRLATDGDAEAAERSAKQRGKPICRRNQREGGLTMRVCQSTKAAHKHGDYVSARKRGVTGERNNAIKPFWSFIRAPLEKKKKKTHLGQTSSWGLCHTGAPSAPLFHLEEELIAKINPPPPHHLKWPQSTVIAWNSIS